MRKLLPYIVDTLTKNKTLHKVHSFDSGAVMIDIWLDHDFFYVIQIDGNVIGISLVTDDTGFDSKPKHVFQDDRSFQKYFEKIFGAIKI